MGNRFVDKRPITGLMWRAIAIGMTVSLGGLIDGLTAATAHSAEAIRLVVGGPLTLSVSVDSLETFANTGELPPELRPYHGLLNDRVLTTMQQTLQRRFPIDGVMVSNLSYSPLGRDAIAQAGEFVRIDPDVNGFYGIRAALINAASHPSNDAGWSLIDVFREFPTDTIDVEVGKLLTYWRWFRHYLAYNRAMVQAIQTEAERSAIAQTDANSADLPDLSQPGASEFEKTVISINNPALRQSGRGFVVNYDYDVDAYVPQGLAEPAPIVVISHGFGSQKENFVLMAEHLASHGFVVLIPEHVGSNLAYRQSYLQGQLTTLLSPTEFVARPQEISVLIDELERLVATDSSWASVLNLQQIGVMGDSFGAPTVFSLAGAEFNFTRLSDQCQQDNRFLNFALYLQCRALFLPPTSYDLKDDRIRAAIASHALGYGLFGPDEIGAIDIPALMISGSNDLVAPVVTEQFYPFMWLNTPHKYLALLTPGTHFSTKPEGAEGASIFPAFLRGQHAEYGQAYARSLTVAFLHRYLREDVSYEPYLSAAYAHQVSANAPMALDIIQSLTAADIEAAYGDRPWIALEQPTQPIAAPDAPQPSVLADIVESHVLRVGLRRDAPPFGFLNANNQWDGYCVDFIDRLRSHLEDQLQTDVALETVELPSTVDNRFELIRNGDVHLECGPNTIRPVDGVAFSQPIFVAATRFLMRADAPPESINVENPQTSLAGVTVGVLPNTTTATFIETRYPTADIVYFDGVDGRERAVRAVADGTIATFAGDDILTLGELTQQGLAHENYRLEPRLPLTCEFYGVLLPEADSEWRRTVNKFIETFNSGETLGRWFRELSTVELNNLQDCLNR